MDILESQIGEGAKPIEEQEQVSINYECIEEESFSKIVERILKSDTSDTEDAFCFVDFDQTVTGNRIRNVRNPQISDEVKESFNKLLTKFSPGRLCLTTNRGYGSSLLGKMIFNTNKVLNTMSKFLEESNYPGTVPVFLGLTKQIPKVKNNGRQDLIDHVADYVVNKDLKGSVKINMIENFSLLGLDRSVFPKGIAEGVQDAVKERTGEIINIDIIDYVLKH